MPPLSGDTGVQLGHLEGGSVQPCLGSLAPLPWKGAEIQCSRNSHSRRTASTPSQKPLTHPLTVPNSPHLPWAERCENVQTADPEDPSPWRKLSQAPTGSLSSGADPAAPGLRRLHRPRTDGAVGTTPADIRAESSSPSPRHPACPFPTGCVHNTCRRGFRRGVRGVNSPRWKDARRSSTACAG